MHPQQVWRWHQAEWCSWHAWGIGCHPEGPGQAQEVGLCEPHEVQQGQVQGAAHGSGQSPVSIQAGGWRAWEQPCQKGFGGDWWMKSWTRAINVHSQPRTSTVSWASSPAAQPAGWGRWFCPSSPLWWDPTWSPVSISGDPSTGKIWTCWSGSRGDHKNDQRAGTPLQSGNADERVGTVQPGEEQAPGRP